MTDRIRHITVSLDELGRADERLSIRPIIDAIYKVLEDPTAGTTAMTTYLREQLAVYRIATNRVYEFGKKRGWYP